MYTLKDVEIKPWVAAQILHFLNNVENAQAIVDGIQDDPNSGSNNAGIGITIAQRIIDKRESLQFKRFRSLEELEDVQGLGSGKMVRYIPRQLMRKLPNKKQHIFQVSC